MAYDIKARPTTYNGIKMRSRLEAQFAARLDRLPADATWAYEPVCFADHRGQYLPDFAITVGDETTYVEVKPTRQMAADVVARKAMRPIWASEPNAHLMVAWPDGDSWNAHTVHGVTTWPDILRRAGVPFHSVSGDNSFETRYEIDDEDGFPAVLDLVHMDRFRPALERVDALAPGAIDHLRVMWDNGDLPPVADGAWRLVGGIVPDNPWGPALLQVNANGRITDRYAGQVFTMTSMAFLPQILALR